jgi:hypothetical protein
MKIIYDKDIQRVPILSWCDNPEDAAIEQAVALSNHPAVMRVL